MPQGAAGGRAAAAVRSANRGAVSYLTNKDRDASPDNAVDIITLNAHKNEELPEKNTWLHFGNMSKKVISNQGFKLQTRFAVLTKACLYFSKPPDPAQLGHFVNGAVSDVIAEAELESVFQEYSTGGSSAAVDSFIVHRSSMRILVPFMPHLQI